MKEKFKINISKQGILLSLTGFVLILPALFVRGLPSNILQFISSFAIVNGTVLLVLKAIFPGIHNYLFHFLENNFRITEGNNKKIRAMTLYEKSKLVFMFLGLYLFVATLILYMSC